MEEWKEYKLGDVCSISSSKRIFANEYQLSGIPFYRGKEIIEKQKGAQITNELYISEERFNEIKDKYGTPHKGDMLLTSVGTLGIPYIVKDEKFYFKDGNLTWFYNFKGINNIYLYYWFLSPAAQYLINAKAIGSTQKALTIETLKKFDILLPTIDVQDQIASILKSLDDKIEVNRRINENLEQQAQALFNEVLMDEKLPRNRVLKDYAYINPTRSLKKGEIARYIDMSSLPTKGSFPSDWVDKPYNGGMKFQNGDTLMARITPCLENGKTAYISFLQKDETAFGSTEYIVMSPHEGMPSEMFYFLARNEDFVSYAVAHMNGSSGRQRVSASDIENYIMPDIPILLIEQFGMKANAIMETIKNKSLESRRLATLRDTLLPKLMSGELKVNDID
ncbi:MAG: restriction endonuclease subunit S [Bacteroidaceae bacterium]|nr:restriction endonuclease subunit S [Bacteroidaceae bacterium]